MTATLATRLELGDAPPLLGDGRSGPPDRREISARWLSGTFLTGLTSSVLMGVALVAALDGRQQLATPAEIARLDGIKDEGAAGELAKTIRLAPPPQVTKARDRRRMEISTITKVGESDVVRMAPFMSVKMALAAGYSTTRKYPAFDPLVVFANDEAPVQVPETALIYGEKVDSEVSLQVSPFPPGQIAFGENARMSIEEVESIVRTAASILTDGSVQAAALPYVDPQRFGDSLGAGALAAGVSARILQENISVTPRGRGETASPSFAEDIIPFRSTRKIADAMSDAGYEDAESGKMAAALVKILNVKSLEQGAVLRLGLESGEPSDRIVRASVYDKGDHVLTIALNDQGQRVATDEPERNPAVESAFEDAPQPVRVRGDLPSIYDGVYRAAYSYGLSRQLTGQLVRLLAADVDYQTRINPTDRIDVFFSNPDENNEASEASELLYVKATFSGATRSFFRFRMADGSADFFDENGRSSRQFLLRNPVPNGEFRSGFGMRRHPILGYLKMHTGVDWRAPTGTPIIASGNGIVEKAGWAGGYGKQTIIRHTNGYETSYSHQSRIAGNVVPGARVRQGQVIGYVGTTGLSTGAHLHYELIVNGTKVDAMRVRLPNGRSLKGAELAAFKRERQRIEALLGEGEPPQKVAAAQN